MWRRSGAVRTEHEARILLAEQARLLGCIALERRLDVVLEQITESITRLAPDLTAAVLRASADGRSIHASHSARLPEGFASAVTGTPIDDRRIGTCGTAIHTGQSVTCSDIENDATWSEGWKATCLSHGIRACHSEPVLGNDARAIATLCLCLGEARGPLAWELDLAQFGARLVAVALERERIAAAEQQAAAQVRASEQTLRELVEDAPFGMYVVDATLRIVHMNRSSQEKAFADLRPVMGRRLDEGLRLIWADDIADDIVARFRHTLDTGEPFRSETFVHQRRDTDRLESYEWELRRITMPDATHGVVCYYFDTTEVRHTELALRSSEEAVRRHLADLQGIYASAPIGMCLLDTDLRYLRVNNELAAMNGLPVEAHIGRTPRDVVPALADQAEALVRRILASRQPERFEFTGFTPAQPGVQRWWDEHWFPVLGADGEPQAVAAFVVEITAERRALQALQESEQRFRVALAHTPILVYGTDDQLRYLWICNNPSQFDTAKALGKRDEDLLPYEQVRDLVAFKREVLKTGQRSRREICLAFEPNEYWDVSAEPLRDAQGAITGLIVAAINVTERRVTELAVRQSEADARLLQALSAELVAQDDAEAIYEKVMDTAMALMESQYASLQCLQTGEQQRQELRLLAHRGFNDAAARAWQRVDAEGASTCGVALVSHQRVVVHDVNECAFMRGTADLATYLDTGICAVQTTPLVSRNGTLVGMLSTHWSRPHTPGERELRLLDVIARQAADVIERRRTEDALRESERRERERAALLLTIMNTSPAPIWVALDRECRQILGNPAGDELLRAPTGANVCQPATSSSEYAYRVLRDGEEVPAASLPMQRAAREGVTVYDDEMEVVRADGSRCWLLMHASPLWEGGEVRGAVSVAVDITARRESEQALREADRRKDEFLATLAHELRNPLAPIRNAVEILRRGKDDKALVETARTTIERQVRHMVRLVDDLLDVSRITRDKLELKAERVMLADAVEQAVEACRPYVESGQHALQVSLPQEPLAVWGDAVRLTQVLVNLLSNACKFSQTGGRIWLDARRDDEEVVIAVRDEGRGIAPDLLPRVFDLFVQGDRSIGRQEGGLGIGLALVKRLIELHGGEVAVQSEGLRHGSVFTIRLPVLHEAAPASRDPTSTPAGATAAGKRRILVVDDNVDSAMSLAMLLTLGGDITELAHDGLEALTKFASFRPEVVLLDIGLPKLDGYETCRRIRAMPSGQDVVIVAVTGWGQEGDRQRSSEAGFDAHLVKPLEPETLSAILARLRTSRAVPAVS
jgi:PAS domain S-box-containing protein